MKIGIIVPSSQLFPLCGIQFSGGVELGLIRSGIKFELVKESAGQTVNKDQVLEKANKLLLQDNVDAVVAYISPYLFKDMAALFDKHKKLLVLTDFGAHISYERVASPYVFYHQLDEWQANHHAGAYHGTKGYKRLLMALSFMEVGYHNHYAFSQGFQKEGGDVGAYHTSPLKPDENYYTKLKEALASREHDLLYCGFVGADANTFFSEMGDAIRESGIAIAGPSLLSTMETTDTFGNCLEGLQTGSVYYEALDNEENRYFLDNYATVSDHEPDRFSVLGYEIGKVLGTAAVISEQGRFMVKDTVRAIGQGKYETPRGSLHYHPEEHYTISDSYVASLKEGESGYTNNIVEQMTAEDMEAWRKTEAMQPMAVWLNPYPCT